MQKAEIKQGVLVAEGFTMIEVIVVVVIISIAAVMAVPMFSGAASMQLRSAANIVASDLEYAKSLSIATQQRYEVKFDASAESYRIVDQAGNVIGHPVKKGFDYAVDFTADQRLNKVSIELVDFDTTDSVEFDYLGSPINGSGNPLNSGSIQLEAGGETMTISVAAVTGFVSIQ